MLTRVSCSTEMSKATDDLEVARLILDELQRFVTDAAGADKFNWLAMGILPLIGYRSAGEMSVFLLYNFRLKNLPTTDQSVYIQTGCPLPL